MESFITGRVLDVVSRYRQIHVGPILRIALNLGAMRCRVDQRLSWIRALECA